MLRHKILKRALGAVTLLVFSFSNISLYASEIDLSNSTLAPYTNFLPHEGTEFKDLAQIRLGIENAVKGLEVINADTIRDLRDTKFSENSVFGKRVKGNIFFSEVNEVGIEGGNVSIEDGNYLFTAKTKAGITYHCLISQAADGVGINISIVSERVLAKAVANGDVKFTHASPDKKDGEIVALYLSQEVSPENSEAIDPWIAKNMKTGNYAIGDNFATNPLYTHPKRKIYHSAKYDGILDRNIKFLLALGTPEDKVAAIKKDKLSRPHILIPYEHERDLPVIDIGGEPVRVYGHSSMLATYNFAQQKVFDMAVGPGQWDKLVVDEKIDNRTVADVIEETDEHETGALCGKKVDIIDGRVQNVLDEYYAKYKAAGRPKHLEGVPANVTKDLQTLAPVNLLELADRPDYAVGKTVGNTEKKKRSAFNRTVSLLLAGFVAVTGEYVLFREKGKADQKMMKETETRAREEGEAQQEELREVRERIEELIGILERYEFYLGDGPVEIVMDELGDIGRSAYQPLLDAFYRKDANRILRYRFFLAIGKIKPPLKEAIPILLEATYDWEPNVRVSAIHALGAIGPDDKIVIRTIKLMRNDENPNVREIAFRQLRRLDPAIVESVPDPTKEEIAERNNRIRSVTEWYVRLFNLADTFKERGSDMLDNERSDDICIPAAVSLGKIYGPDAVQPLINSLNTDDRLAKIYIILSLGLIAYSYPEVMGDVMQELTKMSADENPLVRYYAVLIIGQVDPATPILRDVAKNDLDEYNRLVARNIIEEAEGRSAQPVESGMTAQDAKIHDLIRRFDDTDNNVRNFAETALAIIGEPAKPFLIKALDDERWVVRSCAAGALGYMGHVAKDAIPALQRLAERERLSETDVSGYNLKKTLLAIERIESAETPSGSSEGEWEKRAAQRDREVNEALWLVANGASTPLETKSRLAELLPGLGATPKERENIFDELIRQVTMTTLMMTGIPSGGNKYAAPADDVIRGQIAPGIVAQAAHVFIQQSQFPNDTAKRYIKALENMGGKLTLFSDARHLEGRITDSKKSVVMLVGIEPNSPEFKEFEELKARNPDVRFLIFEQMKDFDKLNDEELRNYEEEILGILLAARSITKDDKSSPTYRLLMHLLEDYMPEGISVEDYIKDVVADAVKLIKTILKALPSSAYEIIKPAVDVLWSV